MKSTSAASQFLPEKLRFKIRLTGEDNNKTSTTDCRQSFQSLRRNIRAIFASGHPGNQPTETIAAIV
ncbi:hypothetical protein [Bradyrhizobium elkanii]